MSGRSGCGDCGGFRHLQTSSPSPSPVPRRAPSSGPPSQCGKSCAASALPELAAGEPEVLGPAPAPVMKLNNRYRYRCLLVGKNDRPTREAVSWLLKAFANDRANRGMNLFVDCNSME